jgi:hypothetical protein
MTSVFRPQTTSRPRQLQISCVFPTIGIFASKTQKSQKAKSNLWIIILPPRLTPGFVEQIKLPFSN